ncbi:unnamed protein product [Penicillium pancosmium]
MDHRVSFRQGPNGQWGNGPAFSQNAGFLPNNTTYGSGPKNNRNWNWKPQIQGQGHNQNPRGRKNKNKNKKKNAAKRDFSGSQQGYNPRYDPGVPKGPRQNQDQNHHQSQNFYPQSSPHQPRWNQQTPNQGRGYNGNNHRNEQHDGYMQNQSNYQENQRPDFYHGHPIHHQVPYQHPSPGPFYDLDDSLDSIISDAAPLFPQGPFIHFGKAEENDIEMPDAPPLDQYVYDYQSVLERIVGQALQSQQVNVDALMYQVFNEIGELKRQNRELNDTVINMFLKSWGIQPQG